MSLISLLKHITLLLCTPVCLGYIIARHRIREFADTAVSKDWGPLIPSKCIAKRAQKVMQFGSGFEVIAVAVWL